MQVKLIVVEGQARQREMVLDLPVVVGRSRAAGLTIGDPKVSRQHCFLEEHGGMVMLRDNGSLNGTILDGQRVEGEAIIRPGAKLTIGPLTFVVVYEPTGEGVQNDTGQMAPSSGEPDFEALLAGAVGDDDAADDDDSGQAEEVGQGVDESADNERATLQWLPPPAASPGAPSFLPPPATTPKLPAPSAAPAKAPPPATAEEGAPPAVRPRAAAKPKPAKGQPPSEPASPFDFLAGPPAEQEDATSVTEQIDPLIADEPPGSADEPEPIEDSLADADDSDHPPEVGEEEEAASSPEPPSKKAPKKKRSWWPFGKKKAADKPKAAAPPAAAEEAEEDVQEEELQEEELQEEELQEEAEEDSAPPPAEPAKPSAGAKGPVIPLAPAADEGEEESPSPAKPSSDDDDDDALGNFFKGIGK
jgi:hypothetical protein